MRTLLTALLFLLLGSTAFAGEVRLSAAASMADAVKALIDNYQKTAPDSAFVTNFAASGTLAKQIDLGAPTDLFISANPEWIDYLVAEGHIAAESVRPLAGNSLVFVGGRGHQLASLADIVNLEHIAIGSPNSVPAGAYAKQALEAAGVWAQLAGKLVLAKDVRQALIYADRGETDGAFVYKTDARMAQRAVILFEVPQALYDTILCPMGLTSDGADNPGAAAFYEYLQSAAARSILTNYGFTVQ